jgi:hypothetical protein
MKVLDLARNIIALSSSVIAPADHCSSAPELSNFQFGNNTAQTKTLSLRELAELHGYLPDTNNTFYVSTTNNILNTHPINSNENKNSAVRLQEIDKPPLEKRFFNFEFLAAANQLDRPHALLTNIKDLQDVLRAFNNSSSLKTVDSEKEIIEIINATLNIFEKRKNI